jgi:hypothetical protein
MPIETAFQQPVGKKLLPNVWPVQLSDDAIHGITRKKKKGNGFESAKLRITGGYLVQLPAKLLFKDKAASFAGAVMLHPLFQ